MAVTRSAAELLARASSRERLVPVDARSGAVFERVVVGSDRYFVKRFGFASDWVMRVSGDRVGRQYLVWRAGIMDRSPGCIDHTVVAMGVDGAGKERQQPHIADLHGGDVRTGDRHLRDRETRPPSAGHQRAPEERLWVHTPRP